MERNHGNQRRPELSDSELAVLKVLWDLGAGTVREVNAELSGRGRRWAYTTVLTLLMRLQTKGCVASEKGEPANTFRPTVSRDELLQWRLSELENDLCEGATSPLVHALVSGKRFTAKDIAHFRRLLDELEAEDAVAKRSSKRGSRNPHR
jgi:BlaI family transcriptional regulator, penicillinase repressor